LLIDKARRRGRDQCSSSVVPCSSRHCPIVILLEIGAKLGNNKRRWFFIVLSSTRGYPEDPDRLEVRVPSWESQLKSEDSDTLEDWCMQEVWSFLKRGFSSNLWGWCISLRSYSTTVQLRRNKKYSHSKSETLSKLQILQYLPYWNDCSFSTAADLSRQQRSKYWSYRATEAVLFAFCSVRSIRTSCRTVSATALQYWTYRGSRGNSKCPKVLLTGPFAVAVLVRLTFKPKSFLQDLSSSIRRLRSQYLSKQRQYPFKQALLKVLPLYPSMVGRDSDNGRQKLL
jgi:hypothetical protein